MSRFLSFACFLATLALAYGSCVEEIEGKQTLFSGGWSGPADLNYADMVTKVEAIAQSVASEFNSRSNDIRIYEPMAIEDGQSIVQKAFTQLVAGENYCIRFTMQSTRCKTTRAVDAQCTDKALICDAKVFAPLRWMPNGKGPFPVVMHPIHCEQL